MNLADYDALWRAFYRELANNGLQAKIFAAGVGDGTLATYCGIYAREFLTKAPRAPFELEITNTVHCAGFSRGASIVEFAEALSKALQTYKQQEAV